MTSFRAALDTIVSEYAGSNIAVRIMLGEPLGPIVLENLDREIAELQATVQADMERQAALDALAEAQSSLFDCYAAPDPTCLGEVASQTVSASLRPTLCAMRKAPLSVGNLCNQPIASA